MTDKRMPASGTETPQPVASDELQRITGIGPAAEKRLHKGGVSTFAQLAALSPEAVAELLSGLIGWSAARVADEDLIGQAHALSPQPVATESEEWVTPSGNGQHYATFTVGLLLDADNSVRRTLVEHIQSADAEPGTWAGWDANRLVDFIIRRAALKLPAVDLTPVAVEKDKAAAIEADPIQMDGRLRLNRLETLLPGAGPRSIVRHDRPLMVELILDMSDIMAPKDDPLECTAAVYAKSLRGGPQQIVAETRGTIELEDSIAIVMESEPLPRGIYRLAATASLALPDVAPSLSAHIEGSLLQVY